MQRPWRRREAGERGHAGILGSAVPMKGAGLWGDGQDGRSWRVSLLSSLSAPCCQACPALEGVGEVVQERRGECWRVAPSRAGRVLQEWQVVTPVGTWGQSRGSGGRDGLLPSDASVFPGKGDAEGGELLGSRRRQDVPGQGLDSSQSTDSEG